MTRLLPIILLLAGLATSTGAVQTSTWSSTEAADFEKGTLDKLSLRSDGRLSLAPVLTQILDSSLPYFWALAEDSKGNVYAGGGGPGAPAASVYVVSPDGKSRVFASLDALEVHALAVDRQDRVYAATSPDGKVYRLREGATPEVFFDPSAKYIWALAFDRADNLFVATGDKGLIYRVTPAGSGAVFYRTEETHARSLAVDAQGNLIVGTEPGGLVLRITPAGEGFAVFQTPKREVTSVAVKPDGAIYAACVGNRQPTAAPAAPPAVQAPAPTPLAAAAGVMTIQVGPAAAAPPPTLAPQPAAAIAGGSEVYRIEPDGYAHKVWSHAQDIVYTIAFDGDGRPLIGTGNKGSLYRLDSDVLHTVLVKAAPTQVTCLYAGREGRLYAATGNIGKVFRIGPAIEKRGSIESDTFDADLSTLWGRLVFRGDTSGGAVRVETRSGNLDRQRSGWSPWAAVPLDATGGRVVSPTARFLQWRLTLEASAAGRSPSVDAVWVAYLSRNAPPVMEAVEHTPANYRFPGQSLTLTPSRNITLQPLGRARRTPPPPAPSDSGPVTMQYEKGQTGVRWAASDPNDDELIFKVEIRGVGETAWKLVKDKVKEKRLSWDSTAYADGDYIVRVTAVDSPDNPPGQELSSQLESAPFLIDNTAPEIAGLTAARSAGKLEVRWKAHDASSQIQSAEYSLDGGEWLLAQPTTRISDAPSHDYVLVLDNVAAGEHTVAVRVADDYDNQSVAKTVIQ
jgi:sugar lactone lactonase YvrE